MARSLGLGSGRAILLACYFIASALLCCLPASSATLHNVGGDSGWSIMTPFATWLQGKTFTVGDSLFFMYEQGWHDVTEVNKEDYDTCNGVGSFINKWTEGNTTVQLEEPGEKYFVCSFIGHCPPMKLAISVVGATTSLSSNEPSASPTESHREQATTPPISTPPTTTTTWSPAPKSMPLTPSSQAPTAWSPHHPMHDAPSSWSPKPSSTPPSWSPTSSWHPFTDAPTWSPTNSPSWSPSKSPSWIPTKAPSWSPSKAPTSWMGPTTWTPQPPTQEPSSWIGPSTWTQHPPVEEPSSWISPTPHPPVEEPSSWISPTSFNTPTWSPTNAPIWTPTKAPTPTHSPTKAPTPTHSPTKAPAKSPTPSRSPIKAPTSSPTTAPSTEDEFIPSAGGPISQSASPHQHSPHFGALFMTIILAFLIMKA